MYDFRSAAVKATTTSPLMMGRDKLDTRDLIANYPQGVTVIAIDIMRGEQENYFIANFREDDRKFFAGGKVFTSICELWLDEFNGDLEGLNDELGKSGGVKMKFSRQRSKNGREYTSVEVV